MRILFSEDESYYRKLGLVDIKDVEFHFGGMKYYNKSGEWLSERYDYFACFMYTLPHNAILTEKFRKLDIPSILIIDGIYDLSNSINNPMSNKYGLILYEYLQQDICISVENRIDHFFGEEKSYFYYLPDHMKCETKKTEVDNMDTKILLTTANSAYFNDDEYGNLLSILDTVISTFLDLGLDFETRIFDKRLLTDLEEKFELNNIIDCSFDVALSNYTHIVTTPSSLAVSAMKGGRAVALLVYKDQPTFISSGWIFTSQRTLNTGIDSFINMDKARMQYQERCISCYESSNSLSDVLEDLVIRDKNSYTGRSNPSHDFLTNSYYNMLESRFNFNFEYFLRKQYLKFKSVNIIRSLRKRLK